MLKIIKEMNVQPEKDLQSLTGFIHTQICQQQHDQKFGIKIYVGQLSSL